MRITFLSSRFPPVIGGGETHILQLVTGLSNLGHTVHVITNKHPNRNLADYNFKITEIDGFAEENIQLSAVYSQLFKVINTLDTDILHVHNYIPFFLLESVLISKPKYKVVFSVHNTPLFPKTIFSIFREYNAEYLFAKKMLTSKFKSLVIYGSQYFRDSLRSIAGKKINDLLIPYSVDLTHFNSEPNRSMRRVYKFKKDDIVILCTSRFVPRKGLRFLIKSLTLLNPKYKLLLLGSTKSINPQVYQELLEIIDKYKLNDRVVFSKKYVTYEQMPLIYKACDLFVMPSAYEGFGISMIEAMATGKPVIGTNVFGINEIINNNYNGILVPYGDIKAIARSVKRIFKEEDFRQTIITNGLKEVQKYSLENSLKAHVHAYTKLIKNDK